ncbi:MAG TPA: M28 family peptidase [Candidatus Thermoplasmatota archaeon]|nr:M28 family peptidase [Candidatus Thermoplasmatota archaeon]
MSRAAGIVVVLLAAALAGCVAPADAPAPDSAAPAALLRPLSVPAFDGARFVAELEAFVDAFPQRQHNLPDHLGSRDALAVALAEAGLAVWRQSFEGSRVPGENVCGLAIGLVEPTAWIIVGAHFDTITTGERRLGATSPLAAASQGAYDNGAGTRIVLELARAFARQDLPRSVAFCFFDLEEWGLEGSEAIHRAIRPGSASFPHAVERVHAMLNFDMFGIVWPVRTPVVAITNSETLFAFGREAARAAAVPEDLYVRGSGNDVGGSDHEHWIEEGVPTLYFSSQFDHLGAPTPVPHPFPVPYTPVGAYPFWHQADTMETLTAMAGGPDMLRASFVTALAVSAGTLAQALQADALDPR